MSNAPAILYDNILTSYTNEYTGTNTSYTTPLTITHDAGSAVTCSGIGIARHTLSGHTVVVEYSSDGVSYTTAATFYPNPDRNVFLGLFTEQTYQYWRVTISGTSDFSIAVIKLGEALRSQRNIYGGHTPAVFNKQAMRKPSSMGRGQFLGRQYHARRAQAEFSATTLTGSWVRSNITAFQDHVNTGGGVFYNWRPDDFQDDSLYGFITGSIRPVNSGPKDFMTVEFNLEGNV